MLHRASLSCTVQPPRSSSLSRQGWRAFTCNSCHATSPNAPRNTPSCAARAYYVPSDKKQVTFLASEDTALDVPIRTPSLAVVQHDSCTCVAAPEQITWSSPSSSPETPGPRTQRQRRPPSYLNDLMLNFSLLWRPHSLMLGSYFHNVPPVHWTESFG